MFFHLFNIPQNPTPLLSGEDASSLLPSSSPEPHKHSRKCSSRRKTRELYLVLKTCLITSCVWFVAIVWITHSVQERAYVEATDEACIRHASHYSPLVNEVKPKWHTVRFNGTFLHENVYRQGAGPVVDAAWEALGVDYRPIVVPVEEAEESGFGADQVQVENVYGGGFVANVEGLHHLHCLNILRKSLKWNYDHYLAEKKAPFSNSEEIVRFHVTHCLDILRQQLMCVPDVGVLGQVWWKPDGEEQPMPFVDFNTKHRCRDFEGVRLWAEKHQLPREEHVDLDDFYKMAEVGSRILTAIP